MAQNQSTGIWEQGKHSSVRNSRGSRTIRTRSEIFLLDVLKHLGSRGPLQKLNRESNCRDEVNDRNAGPHQSSRKLLILEDGVQGAVRYVEVREIDNPITKSEVGGENVAGNSGQE
jgi:hypothetical protein